MAILLNIKADHKMNHEGFESLLKVIKSMLPDCKDYLIIMTIVRRWLKSWVLVTKRLMHVLIIAYYLTKEDEKMTRCTVCDHYRFRPNKEG